MTDMETPKGFTKMPTVTDFPGEYFQCDECKEVILVIMGIVGEHKCTPTPIEAQIMAENQDVFTATVAVNSAPDWPTMKEAIHRLEGIVRIVRHNRVGRASKKFPPAALHKMVADEIRWRIARAREMRDAEIQRNDDMRAKGTPYAERMKLIDSRKLAWCDAEDQRLGKLLSTFRVRPLDEWFGEVDYEAAKSEGMGWLVRTRLEDIIKV